MAYYFSLKSGVIEITSAEKNVLKSDTNHYSRIFLYSRDSAKTGKLSYRDDDGFSIHREQKTYSFSSARLTYYVADNASYEQLKFLPYWDPGAFFFEYMSYAKRFGVTMKLDDDSRQYVLQLTNNDEGKFTLFIDSATYRLTRYIEVYTHKEYGDQYKVYSFTERNQPGIRDSILQELERNLQSHTKTTEEMIEKAEKEYEKLKKKMTGKRIDVVKLRQQLSGVADTIPKGAYILLDFYYQSCLACIKAIPELNELRGRYVSDKLVIVGVDPVPDDAGQKERFIKRYNISYLIADGQQAIDVRNISLGGLHIVYPTLVLINPDGKIEKILDGYSPAHFRELNAYFKEVF